MLSYRHAFHAGNHADILKHYILSLVLDYYNQKNKPYTVIDTHAGAGLYPINHTFTQKNKEFQTGISQLLQANGLPDSLAKFVQKIWLFNSNHSLNTYPGSPKIIESFLRPSDKLYLFELHPNEHELLLSNFKSSPSKQTKILLQDGFKGLIACLPPHTNRGITIIDPPYEDKNDYETVITAIKASLKRFATGCYIVWYPLLQNKLYVSMVKALCELNSANWLNVSLQVTQPPLDGYGMYGSGLFVINPPWTMPKILEESLPVLEMLLGQDESRASEITYQIS
ncbi:MAG: 23S rRNA (adenine(2030)-N(6))-methyltransferase RlmJ [Methylotenera sp.]|jgi:23S rRNA (adenine2030-N6)-methyltransferase